VGGCDHAMPRRWFAFLHRHVLHAWSRKELGCERTNRNPNACLSEVHSTLKQTKRGQPSLKDVRTCELVWGGARDFNASARMLKCTLSTWPRPSEPSASVGWRCAHCSALSKTKTAAEHTPAGATTEPATRLCSWGRDPPRRGVKSSHVQFVPVRVLLFFGQGNYPEL
jgi:hypothetical protein